MKKIILFICVMVNILPMAAYPQISEELGIATPARLTPQTRQLDRLFLDQDTAASTSAFLKTINSTKSVNIKVHDNSPINKIGVGAMNTVTSWTEIPRQVGEDSTRYNPLVGATVGLGQGIVKGLARGASGVVDIATFGAPPYDKPLMQPKYQVARPEDEFRVNLISW